jgi:hypothetical protein
MRNNTSPVVSEVESETRLREIENEIKLLNSKIRGIARKKRGKTAKVLAQRQVRKLKKEREWIITRFEREGLKIDYTNAGDRIKHCIAKFLEWKAEASKEAPITWFEEKGIFPNWEGELQERKDLFASLLVENRIDKLTAKNVQELLSYSWAEAEWWSDKPWKAEIILEKNGLPKFRTELKEFLYGRADIEERFDRFIQNVKGLGGDYATEILTFTFPNKYCLWNRMVADMSIYLGLYPLLPYEVWKERKEVNGKNYIKCCEVLQIIRNELSSSSREKAYFVDVLHFMFYLYRTLKEVPGILDGIRIFSARPQI